MEKPRARLLEAEENEVGERGDQEAAQKGEKAARGVALFPLQ